MLPFGPLVRWVTNTFTFALRLFAAGGVAPPPVGPTTARRTRLASDANALPQRQSYLRPSTLALAVAVLVTNGYVRDTLPGQTVTAAYCEIVNPTREEAVLASVSTPVARAVEVHETRDEDGLLRMRPVPRLVVPPRSTVRLAPGGMHLMLFDARTTGVPNVPFVFEFTDGRRTSVEFEVRVP